MPEFIPKNGGNKKMFDSNSAENAMIAGQKSLGDWEVAASKIKLIEDEGTSSVTRVEHDQMSVQLLKQNKRLVSIEGDIKDIKSQIANRPFLATTTLFDLGESDYELLFNINVILEKDEEEYLAIFPELELYGEGPNTTAAIEDLKSEILDLYDHLISMPDRKLGKAPKAWKRTLGKIIKKTK